MSRLVRMTAIAALLAGSAFVAPQASAHGWHRHHHHHGWQHHHRGHHRVYYRATAPLFGWGHRCYTGRFVTYFGALAYRQVCH